MASFLMGTMNGNSYYEIQFRPATSNRQYGFFGQDNWKVTPKLTLNLGLRYDVTLPRTDRYNRQNSFDTTVASPLNGGSLSYTTNSAAPRRSNCTVARFLRLQVSAPTTSPTGMTCSRASVWPSNLPRRWCSGEVTGFTTASRGPG